MARVCLSVCLCVCVCVCVCLCADAIVKRMSSSKAFTPHPPPPQGLWPAAIYQSPYFSESLRAGFCTACKRPTQGPDVSR